MKRVVVAVIFIVAAAPVALLGGPTKAQKKAIKSCFALYPDRFSIPNESADLAWDRATEWVSLVSRLRLDVATDTVLQSYRSRDQASLDLQCNVSRRKDADETVFTAGCGVNNTMFGAGDATRGTSMLRRYIMTGESVCLLDGDKKPDTAGCLLICSNGGNSCEPKAPELIFPVEAEDDIGRADRETPSTAGGLGAYR